MQGRQARQRVVQRRPRGAIPFRLLRIILQLTLHDERALSGTAPFIMPILIATPMKFRRTSPSIVPSALRGRFRHGTAWNERTTGSFVTSRFSTVRVFKRQPVYLGSRRRPGFLPRNPPRKIDKWVTTTRAHHCSIRARGEERRDEGDTQDCSSFFLSRFELLVCVVAARENVSYAIADHRSGRTAAISIN